MVKAAVSKCKAQLAEAVGKAILASGKKAIKAIGKFLTGRLNVLLSLGELMEFARSEIAGLLALPGAATGQLDTSVSVRPGRVMSYAEAVRLPTAKPNGGAMPGCSRLPAASWPPAGLPSMSLCVQSTDADLNGNGRPDRLLTWRPTWGSPGVELDRKSIGAVAYLDDGSFRRLAVPTTGWTDVDTMDSFDMDGVVHLGADARAQVLMIDIIGSSTLHHTVLGLDKRGDLRPVDEGGRLADVMSGGAAAYGSAWGCVRSRGRPLFVQAGWSRDVTKVNPPVPWSRTFYSYEGSTLTRVGGDSGTAKPGGYPATGSTCSNPAPAGRGPEIGAVR
ncbi:hypothetical protein KOI35_24240 [Actinoplanes bogorensis]|uniref:Uncharacterized protein n=1 Tax=Paractinoplanes bogorensis TaxID=1610840 RepID=A0ABS5YTD4_9ACTN|nr:hypothetical protein [Actinoplanes bogorensis]MBU2666623.1 hypothetical protein [Actinoplanes bogorensis]